MMYVEQGRKENWEKLKELNLNFYIELNGNNLTFAILIFIVRNILYLVK